MPDSTASFSNLTAHGGSFPHGVGTLFTAVVVVIFSMTGVEVATIAAAESAEPDRKVRRAVNTVMIRILTFFVLSTFRIVVAQPWTLIVAGTSPFVTTLEKAGIPGAGTILTAVILVAVLSVLNAGIYISSRLLFVLSENNEASYRIARVNRCGVPVWGVLASTLVGYGCVVITALWPGTVFLFVHLMICASQLKLRSHWEREGLLKFHMWGHPWLPLAVTGIVIAVLVSMAQRKWASTTAH